MKSYFGMGVYLHISNFLHIFRTPFSKNSYEGLLLFFLGRIIIHHHFLFLKKVERTVHIEKNCYLNSFWKYFEYLMCGILWLKYKRYYWKTRPSGLILWISLKCLYRQKQPPEVFYQKRRCSQIFRIFHRKTTVLESLFNKSLFLVSLWSLFSTLIKIVGTYF